MTIAFKEISPQLILQEYPKYFHEKARYFQATKDKRNLCIYGIIIYSESIGEAFILMDSIKSKVFTKEFLNSFFSHMSSLQYKKIYSWTMWKKLIQTLEHFKDMGIEKTLCPIWDSDPRKTWFMMRC